MVGGTVGWRDGWILVGISALRNCVFRGRWPPLADSFRRERRRLKMNPSTMSKRKTVTVDSIFAEKDTAFVVGWKELDISWHVCVE